LLLVVSFFLLLLARLFPVILKLLYTFEANVKIQAFQIVSSPMLFRLLVAFGGAKPLTVLLVRLFLSIELFPKGLGLRKVEVKAIHCVEEFLFLLLSLRWFDGCWKSLSLKERLLLRVKLR
jgi:hypothetical protein